MRCVTHEAAPRMIATIEDCKVAVVFDWQSSKVDTDQLLCNQIAAAERQVSPRACVRRCRAT